MKQIMTIWGWSIGLGAGLVICSAASLQAQNVIFDGTLGVAGAAPTVRSRTPGYRLRYNISQKSGLPVGNNLFHSFTRFNLASDDEAVFGSDSDIRNIFVRVTGNEISDIQGRILTNPISKPNFFLINPTGIYFGANARIDNIDLDKGSGSFFATTVDAIQFPHGQFSAVNPLGKESLMTIVGDPSGFIASQRQPGDIIVATRNRFPSNGKDVNGLAVPGGQNLLLLGGNVFFNNSSLRTVGEAGQGLQAQTDGIHFQVGSVLGAGIIALQQQSDRWVLNLPETIPRGNVSLQNTEIYIGARTGGSLQIDANTLTATDSQLALVVNGGSNLPTARGGYVQFSATGSLRFDRTIVSNEVVEGGNAQGGDVNLAAPQLISRNSQIRADSFGTGNAGNLTVNATQLVDLSGEYPHSPANPNDLNSGPGGLFSQVDKGGRGNGGNLLIVTPLLRIQDGSKIQTATFGTGQAGNITITARVVEVLKTDSPSYYPTSINAGVTLTLQPNLDKLGLPTGNAGALTITADRVKVDGGSITVANFGVGEGGNLQIVARDRIEVDNRGEISTTTRSGQGGNLFLNANNLILLRHGGQLTATAGTPESSGNGGNIQLNAPFVIGVPIENSDITANAFKGRGGNVTITTQQLLGLQFRNQLTPESDITASSDIGLNGTFTLNTPDLDPNRGLVQLPTTPTDPSNRIDQSCASSSSVTRSRFTATGRGGLPSQPSEFLSPSDTLPRLATLPTTSVHSVTQTGSIGSTVPTPPIVEAQAALRLPNGKIRFVVQVGHSVPDAFGRAVVGCQSRQPE